MMNYDRRPKKADMEPNPDLAAARLKAEVTRRIKDTGGKVLEAHWWGNGEWAVVVDSEYAALRLFYVYRHSKAHLNKTPKGWSFSIR